jgi:hypothetical protein
MDSTHTEFGGQGRKGVQRRWHMVVAVSEVPLDLLGRRHTQCVGINWIKSLAVVGVLVGQEHCHPSSLRL